MRIFGRLFLFFVLINVTSINAYCFSHRYDLALNTSYSTIVGSDDTYPKVFVSTPLTLGLNLDYHYAEDSYFSSFMSLNYRSIQFLNDSKNNITVKNEGNKNDIGFKYYLYWNAFDHIRMIAGVRYLNFYYFQSNPLGYIEVHSDFGIIGNLGLEYTLVKNESMTFSLLGLLGASSAFKVQTGYSFDVEGKLTYRYAKNLSLTGALGYAEFHNNTSNTSPTTESSQGRADLNLKLGLQKIF